jgi:hypothetical protein
VVERAIVRESTPHEERRARLLDSVPGHHREQLSQPADCTAREMVESLEAGEELSLAGSRRYRSSVASLEATPFVASIKLADTLSNFTKRSLSTSLVVSQLGAA